MEHVTEELESPPPVVKDKFQCVMEMLESPPLQRDHEQITKHLSWFRQRCDVLSNMQDDKLADVLQSVDLKRMRKDQIVVRQGNEGNCFFIILQGEVSVFHKKEDGGKLYGVPEEGHVISRLDRSRLGSRLRSLLVGNSFGEVVLTTDMTNRTATIVVDEPGTLVVFSRELYNRYFDYSQNLEWREKSAFIHSCPFFQDWTVTYKHLLAENIISKTILHGNPIVKQGEPAEHLFFVSKGQFKVVLDPIFSSQQYEFMRQLQNPPKSKLPKASDYKKGIAIPSKHHPLTVYERRLQRKYYGFVASERRYKEHNVHVTTVGGPMALIGDIEMVLDLPTYTSSAYCTQELKLYVIEKMNFHRIVSKRNPDTFETMKTLIVQKLENRSLRHPEIPLYRKLLEVYKTQDVNSQRNIRREKTKVLAPAKALAVQAFKRGSRGSKISQDISNMVTGSGGIAPQISTQSHRSDVESKAKKDKMNADVEANKKKKFSVADYRQLKKKLQTRGKSISTNIFS